MKLLLKPAGQQPTALTLKPAQESPTETIVDPPQHKWGSVEEVHRRLCLLVIAHRLLYYEFHSPVLQDFEYDLLERFLVHFERTNNISHPNSPTQVVGCGIDESTPRSSIHWAQSIRMGKVPRSTYFFEYLLQPDWQAYLNSLQIA